MSALCESSLDIQFEVEKALTKQGLACIVMVQNATYSGVRSGHEQAFLFDRLVVQLAEQPTVRRAQLKKNGLSSGTSPDVASRVFEVLGAFDEDYKQTFCPQTMEEGVVSGLVVTNCAFTCQFNKLTSDTFTVLSCSYGDYAGVELTAVKPNESFGEISAWEGPVFFGENKWRISVQGRYNTWNLFGPEVGMTIVNGPSPQTVDTLHFENEIDGTVYSLSCARTRTI